MHKLLYTEEAKEQISKFDNRLRSKVEQACEQIAADPSIGKPLTRELKGRFSYRIADRRIIYRVYQIEIVVLILAVGHRRDIYRKQSRKSW